MNSPDKNDNKAAQAISDPVAQNIDAVAQFYDEAEQKLTRPQRLLERVSQFIGQPIYLGCILVFALLWIALNIFAEHLGFEAFDPEPFPWLQGIVSLVALLTTTTVLIKQNRQEKLEEHRSHLELQVNLLSEQKATKIISLLEELRQDLPSVKNRPDREAELLEQPTDPQAVLGALSATLEVKEKSRAAPPERLSHQPRNKR